MVLYKKTENPGDRNVILSIGSAGEEVFIDRQKVRD
jgi:hypothetical protein